jgi:hypothetical protein
VSGPAKPVLYVHDDRQSVAVCVMRDAISFGFLVGSAVALNRLMPPSAWINAALAIAWMLWLAGRSFQLNKQMTPAQAVEWLRAEFPEQVQ